MLKYCIFIVALSMSLFCNVLSLSDNDKMVEILPHSSIYIDKTQSLRFEEVKKKEFIKNDTKKILSYGYSPNFDVWVKFTIKNDTNQYIKKILEYANPISTHIDFFDGAELKKEGLYFIDKNRNSLTPTFHITLQPYEEKTYYLKASSYITTLIVHLQLWDYNDFYTKEIIHQLILALFFGAMFVLGIYNLFIYGYTRDVSYLFYVMYIFSMMLHQSVYTGIAFIYFVPLEYIPYVVKSAFLMVILPVFTLALFLKYFLSIHSYPKNNIILNIILVFIPIYTILFILFDTFDSIRSIVALVVTCYLIYLTLFAIYHKNKQAYFILAGWMIIFIAFVLMYLSSAGILNIFEYFPYIIELAFILEAIIFSIALADRIKQLQHEKIKMNQKLIKQQKSEKQRLKIQVAEKTSELQDSLNVNETLLQELSHRVKNNMQTIISLIRLQGNDIEDEKTKAALDTIKNRLSAMNHLHEYLYSGNVTNSSIDADVYIKNIISEISDTYKSHINIHYDIDTKLEVEDAVYCGLIINELVTNSFKYAFLEDLGNIYILLTKEADNYKMVVKDDGCGFDKEKNSNSLGLNIVETLATLQLRGSLNVDSINGVEVTIVWKGCEK